MLCITIAITQTLSLSLFFLDNALSEAQKSLDEIRGEMLAWQAQYTDIRKELSEVQGTSDTLRVGGNDETYYCTFSNKTEHLI